MKCQSLFSVKKKKKKKKIPYQFVISRISLESNKGKILMKKYL